MIFIRCLIFQIVLYLGSCAQVQEGHSAATYKIPARIRTSAELYIQKIKSSKETDKAIETVIYHQKKKVSPETKINAISWIIQRGLRRLNTIESLKISELQIKIIAEMKTETCQRLINGEHDIVPISFATNRALENDELEEMVDIFNKITMDVVTLINQRKWRKLEVVSAERAERGFIQLKEIMKPKQWQELTAFIKEKDQKTKPSSCRYLSVLFESLPDVIENNFYSAKDLINGHAIFPFPFDMRKL